MKRLVLFFFALLFISPAPAQAAGNSIWIATPANRNYVGEITNKDFEKSLAPTGDLGKLVFQPVARPRTWIMDAALLEDVQFLAAKNSTLATNWLNQIKKETSRDTIYATAYGNPDVIYLNSLAPTELNFYYAVGLQHLQAVLLKNVSSEKGSGYAWRRAKIDSELRQFFNATRQEFTLLSTAVNPKEVETDRARIAQLFSPLLSTDQRDALLKDYRLGQSNVIKKLRIVSGRYQITTSNEKIPVTLVNDFNSSVKVDLYFTPLNNRVIFPQYRQITLNAKSKIQVSVPIKTIAAGDTTVIARFENGKGKVIGAKGIIELSSTIISPAVSRFTTGAGLLLILAAVAQSVRRVRKSRAEK
ncbi:MAG: DUF6049 family protein [Candidatus Nanopelagicaceae bacterium]